MRRNRPDGPARQRGLGEATGDPLDGLVNLFDVGIVLAVAFLVVGLASKIDSETATLEPRSSAEGRGEQSVPEPATAPPARGKGTAVGTVYRLDDGRLIYTDPSKVEPGER